MPNVEDKLFNLLCESEYMDWDSKIEYLIANGVTLQEENRDCHWATERAYKNGYKDGYKDCYEGKKAEGGYRMKQKIRIYLKCGLLMFMVATGFLFMYAYIWLWSGLPETWWAAVLLAVLSGLSAIGLIFWIGKEDHVPVRCGQCRHWTRHEPGKEMGTCFRRGFMNGEEKRESGYCDHGESINQKNES